MSVLIVIRIVVEVNTAYKLSSVYPTSHKYFIFTSICFYKINQGTPIACQDHLGLRSHPPSMFVGLTNQPTKVLNYKFGHHSISNKLFSVRCQIRQFVQPLQQNKQEQYNGKVRYDLKFQVGAKAKTTTLATKKLYSGNFYFQTLNSGWHLFCGRTIKDRKKFLLEIIYFLVLNFSYRF